MGGNVQYPDTMKLAVQQLTQRHTAAAPFSKSYDDFVLQRRMVASRDKAMRFLDDVKTAVTEREKRDVAELRVSDRGHGVPPDQRERIFEPFYRLPGASERNGGVGLGLALVKSIVDRHGGAVRCEETPGGGATFVVTLPRDPGLS